MSWPWSRAEVVGATWTEQIRVLMAIDSQRHGSGYTVEVLSERSDLPVDRVERALVALIAQGLVASRGERYEPTIEGRRARVEARRVDRHHRRWAPRKT